MAKIILNFDKNFHGTVENLTFKGILWLVSHGATVEETEDGYKMDALDRRNPIAIKCLEELDVQMFMENESEFESNYPYVYEYDDDYEVFPEKWTEDCEGNEPFTIVPKKFAKIRELVLNEDWDGLSRLLESK